MEDRLTDALRIDNHLVEPWETPRVNRRAVRDGVEVVEQWSKWHVLGLH